MTHDKIKAAARKRMAETGESYATARREVIKNYQQAGSGAGASSSGSRWFALDDSDIGRVTQWLDSLRGRDSGYGGVEVGSDILRVRALDFRLDIPRDSVRSVARSDRQTRGTIGVHSRRGDWLVNGSHKGLVELAIEPPIYPARQPNTLFLKMTVNSLTISLADPDGFIAAVRIRT